jgi:hypothetical protein
MQVQHLHEFKMNGQYVNAPPGMSPEGSLAPGSRNWLRMAQGQMRPFKGLTLSAATKGSRVMFNVKNGYAGLSDYVSGTTKTGAMTAAQNILTITTPDFVAGDVGKYVMVPGAGLSGGLLIGQIAGFTDTTHVTLSVVAGTTVGAASITYGTLIQGSGSGYSFIANTLIYQGAGQFTLNGVDIAGNLASSTMKVLLQRSGSYTASDSGPYSAGLSQPSSPVVAVPPAPGVGLLGLLDGVYSFKIAAMRNATGARSIGSPTSAVIVCSKQTAQIIFPTAQSGQSHWAIFATFKGFGGVGPHYRMPINGALSISEATVAALPGRTLEFEFKDGDLVPESAWIDDYPPPAGTHAAAIENVTLVGGCYSDATSAPTTTSPGTCIAVSLQNFPESFKPDHLLYLPEQVVGVLGRPSDSYQYWACRNSVHAVQYVGGTSGPACVLTTVWPDVGIANPHGWCQVYGVIFAHVGGRGFVTIGALGQPDDSFSAPVAEETQDWDPALTVVNWHAKTKHVVFSNGNKSLAYNLSSGEWSTPTYLTDYQPGVALAAVQTANQLRINLNDAATGTQLVYDYNTGSSATAFALSNTVQPGDGKATVWEIAEKVQVDNLNPFFVSVHRNEFPATVDDVAITSGTNYLHATEPTGGAWTADVVGKLALVVGAGAAGVPMLAKVGSIGPAADQLNLVDPSTGATFNASTTVAGKLAVLAMRIYSRTPTRRGAITFNAARRDIRDVSDLAIGILMRTSAGKAQPLKVRVAGTGSNLRQGKTN